jgi:hypothetical protein
MNGLRESACTYLQYSADSLELQVANFLCLILLTKEISLFYFCFGGCAGALLLSSADQHSPIEHILDEAVSRHLVYLFLRRVLTEDHVEVVLLVVAPLLSQDVAPVVVLQNNVLQNPNLNKPQISHISARVSNYANDSKTRTLQRYNYIFDSDLTHDFPSD